VREVRRGEDVWLRLEQHLERAIPTFLAAQDVQRFQPRGLAAAIDLADDLLRPSLVADQKTFSSVANALAVGAFPPRTPPQWGLDELCQQLLREPNVRLPTDPEVDEPGELGEALGGSIPDDVATCAASILATATLRPTRLSELLAAARSQGGQLSDPLRLLDVLWGAALYVFVAGGDAGSEDRPHREDLAAAVSALVAVDDGTALTDERFAGPDLLLATPVALDQLDARADDETGAA
jgi:hypothetical protein